MLFDAFVDEKFNEWSLSIVDGDKQRSLTLGRRHLHVRFTLQNAKTSQIMSSKFTTGMRTRQCVKAIRRSKCQK